MKRLFNIFVILFISIFVFNIDVNAESIDFACKYSNGENEIVINLRGEYASKVSFGVTSQLFNVKSEYTFYPANYIIKTSVLGSTQYQTAGYYGFTDNVSDEALYGCPNEIYLANSIDNVEYLTVVDTVNAFGISQLVNGQGDITMPVIFFSTNSLKIANNQLTDENIYFDSALEKTISKNDYTTTKFTLKKDQSGLVQTEKPEETSDKVQYCYYKSSCDKVIELKFTKGNVNMAVFNNGRGLSEWNDTTKCPTSIVDSNNLFTGKSVSCGSGATNCYTFMQQSKDQKSSLIQEGDCSVQSYDTNNGGVVLTKYIFYGSNIDSKNVKLYNKNGIIEAMKNSVTINITNMDSYSQIFLNNNVKSFPRYLVKLEESDDYIFIDSLKSENGTNIKTIELYISQIAFGTRGTGLSDELIISTCKQLFGDEDGGFLQFLDQYVFKVIWIGVPILLILLTTFDFAKVVFVDDKEGIAHAFGNLKKRAIVSVLIFLTPYIIILIANIVDPTQTTIQSCAKTIREMGTK